MRPLQQLVDGPFQLDGGHRTRPGIGRAPALAQRLDDPGRHGVADHGRVPQHRARARSRRASMPVGQHRGQVPGEQLDAIEAGSELPLAGRVRARRAGVSAAALHQQACQLGAGITGCPWAGGRTAGRRRT
jgi:hypothetical protein